MSDLPEGWTLTTLGDLHILNPRHPKDADKQKTVSFVPMPAVSDETGSITDPDDRVLEEVWKGYTHFRNGDVLFAKITPCMENGKIAVAEGLTNGLGCGTTEFHVLRPMGATEPKLIWYYLRDKSFRQDAERSMTGAVGQRRVPKSYLEDHAFPLPPLAEQGRIVEKLDALSAQSAAANTSLTRIETLITRYKAAVLAKQLFTPAATLDHSASEPWCAALEAERDAFKRSLRGSRLESDAGLKFDDLPDGAANWGKVYLGQAVAFASGFAFKSAWYADEGRRLLRGANIAPGRIDWDDVKYLPELMAGEYAELELAAGDIVLAMDRPLISTGLKIALIDETSAGCLLVQRVARIRPTKQARADYVWHLLNSEIFLRHAMGRATGTDLPHISSNDVQTTPIPLPPLEEQAEIVARIEAAFAQIETLARATAAAQARLTQLDRALLTRAFQGKLAPQNPNDDPASDLLKRVTETAK